MSWRITRDLIAEPDDTSAAGHFEEHSRIPVVAAALGFESEPLPVGDKLVKFKLFDDDGELYYEGELHDDDECENQSAALRFGEGAGCTTIKVLRAGTWTQDIG